MLDLDVGLRVTQYQGQSSEKSTEFKLPLTLSLTPSLPPDTNQFCGRPRNCWIGLANIINPLKHVEHLFLYLLVHLSKHFSNPSLSWICQQGFAGHVFNPRLMTGSFQHSLVFLFYRVLCNLRLSCTHLTPEQFLSRVQSVATVSDL